MFSGSTAPIQEIAKSLEIIEVADLIIAKHIENTLTPYKQETKLSKQVTFFIRDLFNTSIT